MKRKKYDEYSNIINQVEGYLYSRREVSSITNSVTSKVKNLQLDRMCNMVMEQKKVASVKKVKALETAKAALLQKYQIGLEKLDRETEAENVQQLMIQQTISDISRDIDRTVKTKSIELSEKMDRIKEQQQGNNILSEKESKRIESDL